MNRMKKYVAMYLAIAVWVLLLPTASVSAADADLRYGRTKLSTDQQYVYDALVVGCETAKAEIKIDLSGRNVDMNTCFDDILKKAYAMFYSDYPEYFWVIGSWRASCSGTLLTVQPVYSIPGGNLNVAKAKYNEKVQMLTSGLSGSDYEKAKTLHDRLIACVDYVSTENDQTAYGALVEGKAVCNGYTRAYQHLMNLAGIPAWFVKGSSINPATNTSIAHAWNLVKLDGSWYYTDVTWDDQDSHTFYAYFNITTEQMRKDHTLNSDYVSMVPNATATGANYYKKESAEFANYDQQKLVSLLKQGGNKTQIYITGDVDGFITAVSANLLSIGEQLGGTGAFQISYSVVRLGNALAFDFTLVSGSHTHQPKTAVRQVNATCLTNGTKAYYVCDCGIRFSDSACTEQIVDDRELLIPVTDHTLSDYKNDGADHWKKCTRCGSEAAGTRSGHTDSNRDNKCDVCAYALPVVNENGGGTAVGGENGSADHDEKPDTGNTENTDNTPKPGDSAGDTAKPGDADDSHNSDGNNPPPDNNDIASDGNENRPGGEENTTGSNTDTIGQGTQSDPEETAAEDADPADDRESLWVFFCAGAVVVAAGAAAAVIFGKKKRGI